MSGKKKHAKHKGPSETKPDSLMHRMMHRHEDLLLSIETTIQRRWREDPDLDDIVVVHALRAMITAEEPEDDRAVELTADLLEQEESRPNISDHLWREAYRVVLDSVYNHSTLQPGNRNYLEFVAYFIEAA